MNIDALIGIIVTAAALVVTALLVLWSRRIIERIAREGCRSAREIEEEMNHNGR